MNVSFKPLNAQEADWLSRMLKVEYRTTDFNDWFCVVARNDEGGIMGIGVAEPRLWFDWYFSCAIVDKRCMSKRLLRAIFTAIFSRARRITVQCEPWNRRAIKQVQAMGFQPEGYLRKAVEGERDAVQFGMIREECRWLGNVRPRLPAANTADHGKGHSVFLGGLTEG